MSTDSSPVSSSADQEEPPESTAFEGTIGSENLVMECLDRAHSMQRSVLDSILTSDEAYGSILGDHAASWSRSAFNTVLKGIQTDSSAIPGLNMSDILGISAYGSALTGIQRTKFSTFPGFKIPDIYGISAFESILNGIRASGFSPSTRVGISDSLLPSTADRFRSIFEASPFIRRQMDFGFSEPQRDFRFSEGLLAANAANARIYALSSTGFATDWAPMVAELTRISTAGITLTDWAMRHERASIPFISFSVRPLKAWSDFLIDSADNDAANLSSATVMGRTNVNLVATDILTSQGAELEDIDEVSDFIETDILAPSIEMRLALASELYKELGRIDPKIPELLAGAWEDIERQGPAAAEKAAHCAIEVLDRTLRGMAPDDVVRQWHTETGRPAKEWEDRNKPTRSLRIKYIARDLPGEDLAVKQTEALAAMAARIVKSLQSTKHASRGLNQIRSCLMTIESLLTNLLLDT